ncbi:hypothetical protein [Streptomyces sp. Ru72]|uniref:hypothetical protein n=1 Tax=Streptomyces sp. Ru72 TaxID=2080747 RepID=UPI0015E35A70|nr:hypothetical protein [Streptomyces sp. Ru72]
MWARPRRFGAAGPLPCVDRTGAFRKEGAALHDHIRDWEISGLSTPGGFKSVAAFEQPPGAPNGEDFFQQTGLSKWIWEQFWKNEGDLYEDPTPKADDATAKAVTDLGTPLYGSDPDATKLHGVDRPHSGEIFGIVAELADRLGGVVELGNGTLLCREDSRNHLPEGLEESCVFTPRITREALEAAVTRPAR